MKFSRLILFSAVSLLAAAACGQKETVVSTNALRAPSYPLISIDPYTSAWSPSDELYGSTVEHWTGKPFPFLGVITVDGQDYRFMGKEKEFDYKAVAAAGRQHPWDGEYRLSPWDEWSQAQGGFGAKGRKPMTSTWFDASDIWARRQVSIPQDSTLRERLYLHVTHKGPAEYRLNGVLVAKTDKACESEYFKIPKEALDAVEGTSAMLEGFTCGAERNYLDMGIYEKREYTERYGQTAVQVGAQVQAMNTIYSFICGPVLLEIRFTAPLFLDRLDLVSRPVNYVSYRVRSVDKQKHDVKLSVEAGAEWALDYAIDEFAEAETYGKGDLLFARTGNVRQDVLWKAGDNVRIDWGWFYLAAEKDGSSMRALPGGDIAFERNLGSVAKAEGKFMVGYDDVYSIQFFGQNLRPYWNEEGKSSIEKAFKAALVDYDVLMEESRSFDADLLARAEAAGGREYAELCALAYRQAIHAHKLVRLPNGELGFFSKENNSNGSIGTVDVTYPSVPLFFIYNKDLVKAMLNFIFYYSETGRWNKPYPAHDVGTYPLANGQTYGNDMPVEEAGNMLTMTAAICRYDGNADYARRHWKALTLWVKYLEQFGLDPDNQLCTDDFAGHFAHNVNLSAKAIMGIACYGYMAGLLGDEELASEYAKKAREMAAEWMRMADDGDHYRLTFDKPDTWSQKYNIIWDKLLGLEIFPGEVMRKEIAYYLQMQQVYGLPLDKRESYTKTDWIIWTAAMAESQDDFRALVSPMYKFYNETVDRIPMGDWVWTDKPERVNFKARSVVGGIFMKMLAYENK